jgi:hypothetical protein
MKHMQSELEYLMIAQAVLGELTALLKTMPNAQEVLVTGILNGIRKSSPATTEALDTGPIAPLERLTEDGVAEAFLADLEATKKEFVDTYKTKKEGVDKEWDLYKKDMAQLILEYEVLDVTVISHVMRKKLEKASEGPEKESLKRTIAGLDLLRAGTRTLTGASLADISRTGEALGHLLASGAEKAGISEVLRANVRDGQLAFFLYNEVTKASAEGLASLVTLPTKLTTFATAGFYEGLTEGKAEPEVKPLSKKAQKRTPERNRRIAEKKQP